MAANPAGTHGKRRLIERSSNRWLMVLYDTLVYLFCCFIVYVLHPSMPATLTRSMYFYSLAGYVFFFGMRFALKCYKQIWRYGYMRAFSRELGAGLPASCLLLLLGFILSRTFGIYLISMLSLAALALMYIVLSITMRVVYCYLYYFANGDGPASKKLQFFLKKFGHVQFSAKKDPCRSAAEENSPTISPINEIKSIAEQFVIHGDITSITQINKGYINRTYRVETLSQAGHVHKYTLQRINTKVFPDVEALMSNYKLTTDHLRNSFLLPAHREKGSVQTIRLTKDGKSFLRDDSGCWRIMTYFDDVYSLDIPDSPEAFYQAGCAFGSFLKEMSDVDASQIKEVIPNFHNTMSRYADLEKAIVADVKGRVKNVATEIEFVRDRKDKFGLISDPLDKGEIPTRVCHNDCNLNNILFDNDTHLPVAVIDLDTVMPSSPLYDFGDSMRIGTNTAKDDEKDLSLVSCDLDLYEQYARGYLSACGDILTRQELELLPHAAPIITVEDGIRFLTDYLCGDTYYNIYYPDQNLDRARTQLQLVADMENKMPQIREILQKIYNELGLEANVLPEVPVS